MSERRANGTFVRRGTGPAKGKGLWGAANGPGSQREGLKLFDAEHQPSPQAQAEGMARKRKRLERIAEAHDKAIDRLMARIEADEVEARDLNAIVRDTGNRMWGAPKQAIDHTHKSAEQMTDDELAAIAAGRGGTAAAPESDTPVSDTLG